METPGNPIRAAGATPGVHLLWREADDFPVLLRSAAVAPDVLHVRGELRAADALAVAVVGARRATAYGIEIAERLAGDLAARGVTVVSGLARGIDSAAHRGALGAGGRTIAVLGSGVDVIYPPENRRLAKDIIENGAVVSELALGTPPLPYHFPRRNRLIAGLALGVVVVEAAERSGALSTAGWAADLGREVMAVPGKATSPTSRGAHRLIKDGAALVESWEDVVDQLPAHWRACLIEHSRATVATAPDQRDGERDQLAFGRDAGGHGDQGDRVLGALGDEPATIEEVIARSGVASGLAAGLLLTLELEGRVRQLPGKRFVRIERGQRSA